MLDPATLNVCKTKIHTQANTALNGLAINLLAFTDHCPSQDTIFFTRHSAHKISSFASSCGPPNQGNTQHIIINMIAATTATSIGRGQYDYDNMAVVKTNHRVSFVVDQRNCVQVDVYIIPRYFDIDPTLHKRDLFYQPRDIRMFRYEKELEEKYTNVHKKTDSCSCDDNEDEEEKEDELSSIMRRRFLRRNFRRCKSSQASRRQQRIIAAATLLM